MRLPNAEHAVITIAKMRYLLNANHPQNGGKEAFYRAFGFSLDAPERLANALRDHAAAHEVVAIQTTPFGTRYTVRGALAAPDGRNPFVDVGWHIDSGETVPRLITAVPSPRGR